MDGQGWPPCSSCRMATRRPDDVHGDLITAPQDGTTTRREEKYQRWRSTSDEPRPVYGCRLGLPGGRLAGHKYQRWTAGRRQDRPGRICRRQGVATRRRWRRCFGATTRVKIRAERPSSRDKNLARGPNFSDWQVKFGKLLEIDLFFLWQNIWGVAKLQDLGNKKSQTVGVALSLVCLSLFYRSI